MVIQRDKPIYIWGWAEPGEVISVHFRNQHLIDTTGTEGLWSVTFAPEKAGGPYNMRIIASAEIRLENILIGDVWMCSGQSNMQWPIRETTYHETDSSRIRSNQIRLFTVPIDTDYLPRKDIKGGIWKNLSWADLADFSAVAYHFGRVLQDSLSVPIGLISNSLGATSIETWMSNEMLLTFEQFQADLRPVIEAGMNFEEVELDLKSKLPRWKMHHYLIGPGIDNDWHLPAADASDWMEYRGPGVWEEQGLPNHDGAVWFRTNFDLPTDYEKDSFSVSLSQIDDYDITWINGHEVGSTFGRHNHRNYSFPTAITQPKDNVIVIRAFDIGGSGGFSTHPFWTSELVRGPWKMKPGLSIDSATFPKLFSVNVTPFSSPSVLFNANIAPLTNLAIRGIIWYQGESNANRAVEYKSLFPALIQDWRNQWNDPNLPFFFVQLANFGKEDLAPRDSEWAELREAQDMALRLPFVGQAVTIDIGEADDIHPKNKFDVGRRLALCALEKTYDFPIQGEGPVYKSHSFHQDTAIVAMVEIGSGLITTNKFGYVHGFAIASDDQQFHWAKAQIKGNELYVWSDSVQNPTAIRYCWSDNPGTVDLYNQEGFPAAPFRTDDWPLSTRHNQYDHRKARF